MAYTPMLYSKDGETRIARTRIVAVELEWDGWKVVGTAPPGGDPGSDPGGAPSGGVALPPGALVYRGAYTDSPSPAYAVDEAVHRVEDGHIFKVLAASPAGAPSLASSDWLRLYPPAPTGYALAVLADDPVGYWRLNETSGFYAASEAGPEIAGLYVGTPTLGVPGLVTSESGTAVAFSGSNQYVDIPATQPLHTRATLEALIKPDVVSGVRNFLDRDSGTGGAGVRIFQFRLNNATLEVIFFVNGGAVSVAGSGAMVAGTTYHVAATFDGTTVRLYRNGVQVGQAAATGNLPITGSQPASIGRNGYQGGTQWFDGVIDEAAIYDTALSPARILAHAQAAGLAA